MDSSNYTTDTLKQLARARAVHHYQQVALEAAIDAGNMREACNIMATRREQMIKFRQVAIALHRALYVRGLTGVIPPMR